MDKYDASLRGGRRAMRILGALAVGVGSAVFLATTCWAATIVPVQGQLSVNQGQGFAPVNGRVDANIGDSVMVSPNGSAVVSYPDGCQVGVQPGAVMTIAPLSPCASGSYAQEQPGTPGTFTPGGMVLLAVTGAVIGVVGYEISKSTTTTTPASP